MSLLWFEPKIPVFERTKTFRASDRATTVIVPYFFQIYINIFFQVTTDYLNFSGTLALRDENEGVLEQGAMRIFTPKTEQVQESGE
jgi:hypothetical protein